MNRFRYSADSIDNTTREMFSLVGRAIDATEFKKRYMFVWFIIKIFAFLGMVSTVWCLYLVYGAKEPFIVNIEEEEGESVANKKKVKWNKTSTQMKVAVIGIGLGILGVLHSVITISKMHPVDRALVDTRASMEDAMSIPVPKTVDTVGAEIKTGVKKVAVDEDGKKAAEEIEEGNVRVFSPVRKSLKKRRSTSDKVYRKRVKKALDDSENAIKRLQKEGDKDGVQDIKNLLEYLARDMDTKISPPKFSNVRTRRRQ